MARTRKNPPLRHSGKSEKRGNRIVIMLNDREKSFLDRFCARYKITNRAKLLREVIMGSFLKKLEEDYPTLWDNRD